MKKSIVVLLFFASISNFISFGAVTFDDLFNVITNQNKSYEDFNTLIKQVDNLQDLIDERNMLNTANKTLLISAIERNKTKEAMRLIELGADIYPIDLLNKTALDLAVERCNTDVIEKLLKKNNESDDEEEKAKYLARNNREPDLLTLAIQELDPRLSSQKEAGDTTQVIALLLNNDAKITEQSSSLYYAFLYQYENVIKLLLDAARKQKTDIQKLFEYKNPKANNETIEDIFKRRANNPDSRKNHDPRTIKSGLIKNDSLKKSNTSMFDLIVNAINQQKEEFKYNKTDSEQSQKYLMNFGKALKDIVITN